jgi:hypothetical protein
MATGKKPRFGEGTHFQPGLPPHGYWGSLFVAALGHSAPLRVPPVNLPQRLGWESQWENCHVRVVYIVYRPELPYRPVD